MVELMFQAQKHMTLEDVMVARRDQENEHQERLKRKRDKRLKFIEGELRTRETVDQEVRPREARSPIQWTQAYTPLNSPLKQVFMYVQEDPSLKWPEKLKTPPEKRSQKYCWFHQDHGHNTEDCVVLKEQIEALIQQRRLRHFIVDHPWTLPRAEEEPPS